jgi:hypothetical protein
VSAVEGLVKVLNQAAQNPMSMTADTHTVEYSTESRRVIKIECRTEFFF